MAPNTVVGALQLTQTTRGITVGGKIVHLHPTKRRRVGRPRMSASMIGGMTIVGHQTVSHLLLFVSFVLVLVLVHEHDHVRVHLHVYVLVSWLLVLSCLVRSLYFFHTPDLKK